MPSAIIFPRCYGWSWLRGGVIGPARWNAIIYAEVYYITCARTLELERMLTYNIVARGNGGPQQRRAITNNGSNNQTPKVQSAIMKHNRAHMIARDSVSRAGTV